MTVLSIIIIIMAAHLHLSHSEIFAVLNFALCLCLGGTSKSHVLVPSLVLA